MPESDDNPRAARQLREFGRRRAPDDLLVQPAPPTGSGSPTATAPAPGSIWGPQTAADVEAPPATHEPVPSPEPVASPEPDSKHGRRSEQRRRDPDAVDIDADTSHDWWAKRDDLDHLVNPKKRGAAARAQRAAREAFAPAGATSVPSAGPSGAPTSPGATTGARTGWDPADVYSFSSTDTADPPPQVNDAPSGERGWHDDPWDDLSDARSHEGSTAPYALTPWDVLGLTSEATWAEVSRRHKQLAKEHHPDRHHTDDPSSRVGAESRMSEINAAFSDLRRIYQLTDGT